MNHFLTLALAGMFTAGAQVYTPPDSAPPAPASPPPAPATSSGNQTSNSAKSPIGNEIPFMDPGMETISFGGRSWPVGDMRILAARYEKYLSEPEDNSEDSKVYRKFLADTTEIVLPKNTMAPIDKLRRALRLLAKAGEYDELDAGQSNTLCNAVYGAFLSKGQVQYKKMAIDNLNKERKSLTHNMSLMESRRKLAEVSSNDPKKPAPKPLPGIEYATSGQRLVEIEALKKTYEGEGTLTEIQAKIIFQGLLVNYCFQRRFEHSNIGSCLYNLVFTDGDNKLKLEKGSDSAKLFGETLGVPPTVSTIEDISKDAINDTRKAIEAVKFLIQNKRLTAANKRLAEAFFIGEYLEPVRTLPLVEKQKLSLYAQDIRNLISAMENKDFDTARTLVKQLQEQSSDFQATKAVPLIETAVQASNLHLLNAQQAMFNKDTAKAQDEVKLAMQIWPMNPEIKNIQKAYTTNMDIVKARDDFERLIREQNYRQVFRDQYRFAPAIQGDARLEDAFKQIISNITKIETSLEKAKQFNSMGQHYAAWEELKRMHEQKVFSQDPELGTEIVKLSSKASSLAEAIETAKAKENAGETGSALSWYLKARSVYPSSDYAKEGIERLLDQIFTSDIPQTEPESEK